ncbi:MULTISPECIES: antiviral reverse transcriptase Drt3b [Xanthomonas]|uniref:antiviral reverse transcriptase Drt3b n=1 Tax=Xanthomonas TaxID=338 RepID=UPI000E1E5FFD|nr:MULTISPECIES: antiviral reverse transcriptase Drt3b [Xanthomonas]
MASKKKKIDIREAERALLTDTLPYELPLFFNNANFAILAFNSKSKKGKNKLHERMLLSADDYREPTKPYSFVIKKDSSGTRRLSLSHPRSQHIISRFYGQYDEFVCNACNRSNYSLRYPSRVATHYVDPRYALTPADPIGKTNQVDEDPVGFRDQSKWASTFFSYRDFSLSHKFFESESFLELERKFSFLMKLDVSKCFDSIYTHSIEWSMRGKDFSKNHLPNPARGKVTFESEFDAAVRHSNWNETHGIIVGPESSRIFAEVVLQSVDRSIERSLDDKGLKIEIRRYVDDFYIFGNSQADLELVKKVVRDSLSGINLHLNESKTETSPRPFVSKISVARVKVARSIEDFFGVSSSLLEKGSEAPTPARIERSRSTLIGQIRRMSAELGVPYERFASYALATINKKILTSLEIIQSSESKVDISDYLSKIAWLTSIIRVSQFLFSTDRRIANSVKLATAYFNCINLAAALECPRAPLERQILDGLRYTTSDFGAGDSDEICLINHLCVVDLLLTEKRRIEKRDLIDYIGDAEDPSKVSSLSVFQLVAILFISRKRSRFKKSLMAAVAEIEKRVEFAQLRLSIDTEAAILLTEYIACPYIEQEDKIKLVSSCYKAVTGQNCSKAQARELISEGAWITFTDWSSNNDLAKMLARKELTPAYE